MAHFIAEFTYSNTIKVAKIIDNAEAMKEVEMEIDGTPTKRLEDSDLNGEQ